MFLLGVNQIDQSDYSNLLKVLYIYEPDFSNPLQF